MECTFIEMQFNEGSYRECQINLNKWIDPLEVVT